MKFNTYKFKEMDKLSQLSELGRIIYHISMHARETYEAGSERVIDSDKLRRINEIIHRISSLHLSISSTREEDISSFIDGTFDMLEHEAASINLPDLSAC
jgi:hypothetical protein